MITDYINAALHQAEYELMENGRFFGSIPACQGCWGEGPTLEAARDELASALQDWLMVKIRFGDELPIVGGIDLNPQPVYAEAN